MTKDKKSYSKCIRETPSLMYDGRSMENDTIADIFQEIADILEIQDDSIFRIRSYQRASQVIRNYPHNVREIYEKNPEEIDKIPSIGVSLSKKIIEILKTGKCRFHERLIKKVGRGLADMLKIRGVGPKKVKLFYRELRIDTIEKLRIAAKKGLLRDLPKMGEKSEQEILKAIEELDHYQARTPIHKALQVAEEYCQYLKSNEAVWRIEIAGSLRRRLETIGDIDILAAPKISKKEYREKIVEHFVKYDEVKKILSKGDTKASILLKSGMQIDLRVVDKESFGAALQYFTGSKTHNVAIRNMAKKRGLKISEYGVFRGVKKIAGETEEEVYKSIGLPCLIPEIRENRGEIEAAKKGLVPQPLEQHDLRGDLHTHTKETDGSNTIETMAQKAQEFGYEYIAITDHSKAVRVANGMDEKRLLNQIKVIDELNAGMKNFRILKGIEVDILGDGTLDMPDTILKQLDIVIASVHSKFHLNLEEQTKRVLKALKNPHLKILGHPTGRLLQKREPIALDMERIVRACKVYHKALEINASPSRLDLNDIHARMAKDAGVKMVIDTDSHHYTQFEFIKYGIFIARRAWLTKDDILNTRPVEKLLNFV